MLYFVAAYLLVWVLIFAYVALLNRRVQRAERRLQKLEEQLAHLGEPEEASPDTY